MTIAGYAIGQRHGHPLPARRVRATCGRSSRACSTAGAGRRPAGPGHPAAGRGFDFDIRIQMGAGAYVCGEETALISSCEGLRGDPKNRPPFPAQKGYLGCPTIVNNVETLCCVARILVEGRGWFAAMGSARQHGHEAAEHLRATAGSPGVYEVPFGITAAGAARDGRGGERGRRAGRRAVPADGRAGPASTGAICYDDLATGGAIMVFGRARNVLEIAEHYMDFFVEESCGYCTPCRVGQRAAEERWSTRSSSGAGEPADLDGHARPGERHHQTRAAAAWGRPPQPGADALENFRDLYDGVRRGAQAGAAVRRSTCPRRSSTPSCGSAGSRNTSRGPGGTR